MKPSSPFTRTLQLAADTIGVPQLAERLGVERARLERWIKGEETPPNDIFIQALDIVAAGQLGTHTAKRAQAHADRLQASADRAQEAADRVQATADRARKRADQLNPKEKSQHFRAVQPKDGEAASNEPAHKEDKGKKA